MALHVPANCRMPIVLLRWLNVLPAAIDLTRNMVHTWDPPLFDQTGVFEAKSTRLMFGVSCIWCALAGYWSWMLTTNMLCRWLHHYELSNVMVRFVTLTVIQWAVAAVVSSHYGPDQPLHVWIAICSVLLIANAIMMLVVSKGQSNHRRSPDAPGAFSAPIPVLVFPLTVVVVISMVALLFQASALHRLAATDEGWGLTLPPLASLPEFASQQGNDGVGGHGGGGGGTSLQVLVLVLSSWTRKSADRRQTFRETTLTLLPRSRPDIVFTYRFVIGDRPVNESWYEEVELMVAREQETYNDILMVPAPDRYETLSEKVWSMLAWSDQYAFDYLVKTDDDIFVRWDTLSDELVHLGPTSRYWRGLTYWGIPPIRSQDNKNAEMQYTLPVLPPFTAGALYILSRDVVHLAVTGGDRAVFLRNEDQNLGLWLYPFAIQPIHDRRIQQFDVCENDMIAKHFGDFSEPDAIGGTMHDLLQNLQHHRPMCTGFKTTVCALCYPCDGKPYRWTAWGYRCHPTKGVSLIDHPPWTIIDL